MSSLTGLLSVFSKFSTNDWIALALFLFMVCGYRFFLSLMLRLRPDNLFLGKLQEIRTAWIEANSGGQNSILVVQTLRNTLMSASFLASTAVLLIMGAFSLLPVVAASDGAVNAVYVSGTADPAVDVFKILLIIIMLSYSFFNLTWYIREINYMAFMLNIPKERLDQIEGTDSTAYVADKFLRSGIHFSLGMRGFYFVVPLMMWFFSPVLMICASVTIVFVLMRRDMGGR